MQPRDSCDIFVPRVGWISALPIELAAARGMLDEEHGNPQTLPQKTDNNSYVLGQIHNHKVVIACLPRGEVGASSAALVAQNMLWSFPNIRIGLMVGIGAGIPRCSADDEDDSDDDEEEDVHLGDVVISSDKKTGGVVAYNFGKKLADGSFEVAYHLDQPPRVLRITLASLEAAHEVRDNLIPKYIDQMLAKLPAKMRSKWVHPGLEKDLLFAPDYMHSSGKTCKNCDQERALRRGIDRREDNIPVIHYGVIATGSEVVRHAPTRDQIRSDHNAICLEMEAAGLMNNFPCLVIRGISDYADSHKNDRWHRYAAAAAAACAKELLSVAQPLEVEENPRAAELVGLLDKIDSKLDNVDTKISTFITASQEEKLRKWLSASNPETNFKAALGTYHPGTCLWFLEGDIFRNWKLASRQSLWMHGIPGSGKTVMSSKIIDNLLSEKTNVLYFFFDTRDSEKQTLDDLLRSLILQLYTEGHSRNIIESLFVDKFAEGNKRLFSKDLETIFLSMVSSSGRKFKIIFDALDECSTKEDVLDWVQSSNSKSELAEVGFFITSRNDKVIESGFKKWLNQDDFVPLETEAINKDLTGYIEFCLQSGRYFERWSNQPGVLLKMKEGLVHRADGMFRLAVCQLEILKSCIDIGQVEDEIKRLPRTLEGVYERILRDIREHHHTRVVRILQFLVYSQRPLRIDELVDAIAVDLSREPEFEPGRRMPDPQGILEMCPSLLASRQLNAEDNKQRESNKTEIVIEVVELAHATVKEYLISLGSGSKFYSIANPVKAQGIITTVCLAYLSLIDEKEAQGKTRSQFPLAQFSSRYWLQYAKGSDEVLEVREATIRFLSDERTRHIWGSLYNPDFPAADTVEPYKMATPLYYASLAGLSHTVTKLLQMGADPMNADGGEYGNSLQAACAAGQEDVVKILLLERGVDVNRAAGSLGNALQAASTQRNEAVISMLLEKGAQIQANEGKYGTALQAASARSNLGVVRLLLNKGADPNLIGGKYNNALYIACLRGHKQIVKFLLDHGADRNAESPERGTPLQAAAEGNHTSIVQILLDNGANIDKTSGLYGCTLQLACVRGSEKVVRQLLDNGANPNQAGGLFGSPLQAASARGDVSLVRSLLEKGADPNAWGGYYKTSIQAASANGHVEVIKLLIDKGADVNAHDRADEYSYGPIRDIDDYESGNPAVASEETNDKERLWVEKLAAMETNELQEEGLLVKQLLSNESKPRQKQDEDPNQGLRYRSAEHPLERFEQILLRRLKKNRLRDGVHSNALQAASAQGWMEAVALLLEAGADTKTCEGIYGNPLQASSAQGHVQIVKLLIDNGANPNKLGGFYGTALQAASARGHDEVVAVLLDNWADPRREGGAFDASLPAAAARGHTRIVELLLQHPGYLNPEEKMFQRALYSASAGAYIDIIKLLLERGADMDVEEEWYIGALQIATKLKHFDIVKMLLENGAGINVPIVGDREEHPLYVALRQGNVDVVKLFAEAGADLNMGKDMSSTPLCAAAQGGHAEMIRLLVDHGAELISEDDRSSYELEAAVKNGHEEAVALLLELGAIYNGSTLEAACRGKHETILRMLVRSPAMLADTSDGDSEYMTHNPLQVAALGGDENLVRILLEAGFPPKAGALQEASARGDLDMVKLLLQAGSGIDEQYREHGSALQAASKLGNLDLLHLLIEKHADVNTSGGDFGTALQAAIHHGHGHIIDTLLKAGADINVEGGCRGSALQAAADSGNKKLVETLLGMGCQTINTHRGKYGNALQAASRQGHLGIAQLLLDHGADVNTRGGKYGTALRAAVSKGHLQIMQLLLGSGAVVDIDTKKQRRLRRRYSFAWNAGASLKDIDLYEQFAVSLHPTIKDSIIERLVGAGADHKLLGQAVSVAARDGNETSLKRLIQWAATHEIKTSYNEALSEAAKQGSEKLVKILLENGVDPRAETKTGPADNSFFAALNRGHESLSLLLLEAGASIFSAYQDAFEKAARKDLRQIMPALLSVDMDTYKRKDCYNSALRNAASCGKECIMNMVFEMAEKYFVQLNYDAALTSAAIGGNENAAKLLIKKVAQLNLQEWAVKHHMERIINNGDEYLAKLLLGSCSQFTDRENNVHILHLAARKGLTHIVTMLLENGVSPTSPSSDYQNVFEAAAAGGHSDMLDLLWSSSGIKGKHSGVALRSACRYGSPLMVEKILKTGVDVNSQDGKYGTALCAASKRGHRRIAKMLIEAGADVNSQNATFGTALQCSAARGHARVAEYLIENGARITREDENGVNTLQAAAKGSHLHVIDLLLRHGAEIDPNAGQWGGAIQAAASAGNLKTIRFLLDRGADVNSMGGKHGSALHVAAHFGKIRTANLLLDEGASPDATWGRYGTPLHVAVTTKQSHIARKLVERGANVNIQGGLYGSALQALAVVGSHWSVEKELIKNGADINSVGGKFGCALQAAAKFSPDLLKLLLKRGADPNIQGGEYGNPLQAACSVGTKKPIKMLIKAGAEVNSHGGKFESSLIAACMSGSREGVETLLNHGADVNLYLQDGQLGSPLHAACFAEDKEIVELLLARGADVDLQFGEHGNALQVACMIGNQDIGQLLLDKGANTNAKGGKFGNALQAASWAGNVDAVKMLLDHGAEVNQRGGFFEDALQAASSGSIFPIDEAHPLAHFEAIGEADSRQQRPGSEGSTSSSYFSSTEEDAVYPNPALLRRRGSENAQYEHRSQHHVEVVQLLLDNGAHIHTEGGHFGNALQAAVVSGNESIVEKLMDAGADVNAAGGEFGTSLVAAATYGLMPIARRLLDAGADPNSQSNSRGTALISASSKGHSHIVQLLLDRGADINATNQENKETALMVATKQGHDEIVKLLETAGAAVGRPEASAD
ncbi:unnamed protein product [Clonostachys rosea]|uniref:Nucleoside phosphorylase domain-containing protein n=1 Tax=Bionectria ochroleuca TaxID=29856 RepID=A0ABY6UZB6_BIOOC|nr:unnamed protein product [Clonostachys rosea]